MPTSSSTPQTLGQQINIATRPLHTQLNALILSLLPLALPRHETHPDLYAKGLSPILQIYSAFETALDPLSSQHDHPSSNDLADSRPLQIKTALQSLQIPALTRTSRLQNDIAHILHKTPQPTTPAPKLLAFTTHITSTLPSRPHFLLAYTWIFYMALFSGGRYIRSKLQHAGPEFWGAKNDADTFLTFWIIEGDNDGEDVKGEFKRRFGEVEAWLTEEERGEVVDEGVVVMREMVGVVAEIAEGVGGGEAAGKQGGLGKRQDGVGMEVGVKGGGGLSLGQLLMKHILPVVGMVELITGASKAIATGMDLLRGSVMGGKTTAKL